MAENDRPLPTERFEDYLAHHRREHELIHEAQEAAKRANDYRLDGLNALRKEVERDRSEFVKIDVASARHQHIEDRLRKLEQDSAARSGATVTWVIAVGIIFTVLQIALRFI
jgi:hypothetical protein